MNRQRIRDLASRIGATVTFITPEPRPGDIAYILACRNCGGQGCVWCDPPTHPGDLIPDDPQPFLPEDE